MHFPKETPPVNDTQRAQAAEKLARYAVACDDENACEFVLETMEREQLNTMFTNNDGSTCSMQDIRADLQEYADSIHGKPGRAGVSNSAGGGPLPEVMAQLERAMASLR